MKNFLLLLMLISFSSIANAQLPTPVGYWPMNGTPQDSVGVLNGVLNGAISTADRNGNLAKAYEFDGVNDHIELVGTKDDLAFIHNTGVFTISMYLKMDNLNDRNYILSSSSTSAYKGFLFMWETYGGAHGYKKLKFHLSSPEFGTWLVNGDQHSIADNNWHHVAVVGNGSTIQFYVDGQTDGTPKAIGALGTGQADWSTLIGATPTTPNGNPYYGFDGAIDELLIFDEALTGQEITDIYNGVLPDLTIDVPETNSTIPGAIGHWPMNGDVLDQVSNMHGAITGAQLTADQENIADQAYLFDGVDDHIELTNSTSNLDFIHTTGTFTLSLFVKIDDLSQRQVIMSSSTTSALRGFSLFWEMYGGAYGINQLRFGMYPDPALGDWQSKGTQFSINNNDWHHIAVVGDGTEIQLYVDGYIDGAPTAMGNLGTFGADHNLLLGASMDANGTVFNGIRLGGAVDNLQIYDVALSLEQISHLATGAEPVTLTPGSGTSLWSADENANIFYEQGKVSVGAQYSHADYALAVKGTILAEGVKVQTYPNWPDYVFEPGFDLLPLDQLDKFIELNRHLPGLPSASQVLNNGFELSHMNAVLLKKIEELTLYTIDQEKMLKQQTELIESLILRLEKLEKQK